MPILAPWPYGVFPVGSDLSAAVWGTNMIETGKKLPGELVTPKES
jgi:hypothetical protein